MLYAMSLMVLLTTVVGVLAVRARFAGVLKGGVRLEYFKLMEGDEVPDSITRTTRCFNNLFEIPVLFYAAGTLHLSLGVENTAGAVLAWLFVLARYIQAGIHLTYNRVIHRMLAFFTGFACAVGLWVNLLIMYR